METLADRILRDGALNELDAVGWVIRLAKRLEALHQRGTAHGSISPGCVLTASKDRESRGVLADVQRTPQNLSYQSPERRATGASGSPEDDTWALAATLYFVLTGKPPFAVGIDARKSNPHGAAPLAAFDVGDDELQHALDMAFARDRTRRMSHVGAFRRELERWHPDANAKDLPPLEDDDKDDDDERTVMRAAPAALIRSRSSMDDDDSDGERTLMRLSPLAEMGAMTPPPTRAAAPRPAAGNPPPSVQRSLPTPGFRDPALPLRGPKSDDDDSEDGQPRVWRFDPKALARPSPDGEERPARTTDAPFEVSGMRSILPRIGSPAPLREGVSAANAARIGGLIDAELSTVDETVQRALPSPNTWSGASSSGAPLAAPARESDPIVPPPGARTASMAAEDSKALLGPAPRRGSRVVVYAIVALLVALGTFYALWLHRHR